MFKRLAGWLKDRSRSGAEERKVELGFLVFQHTGEVIQAERGLQAAGFRVEEHSYYRQAVDELGYTIKPYQYELHLEVHEDDLANLKSYLTEHFTSGEKTELWNLWVGNDREERPIRYRGTLSDFDLDTLEQFLTFYIKDNKLNQCCMTIVI